VGSIPITRSSLEAEERVKRKGQRREAVFLLSSFPFPLFSEVIAHIAQSVEHFLGKEEVIGSIPIMGSRFGFLVNLKIVIHH
jgi:hypothetical protein